MLYMLPYWLCCLVYASVFHCALKKTSTGFDRVPYWVFKHCAVELAPVITHLINTVVKNGMPPSSWIKALVTPVPKKTPPAGFSDLRPISVTPITDLPSLLHLAGDSRILVSSPAHPPRH